MNFKQTLAIALIAAAPAAFAGISTGPISSGYRIDVEKKQLNGLDIAITTSAGPAAAVLLENRSGKTARCKVDFINGPQLPRAHEVTLAPGQSTTVSHPAAREVTIYRIGVTCAEVAKPAQ